MNNKAFRDAYKSAAEELESLLTDQERIEERILSLRKSMTALATLISQHEGKDKDFTEYAHASLQQMVDTSLTRDIHRIVAASKKPLTATEIKTELTELGAGLDDHSNPLATIHAILNRLAESKRAKETVKDGKKAWMSVTKSRRDRIRSMAKKLLSDSAD